jgi:putative ABC transport system substrate-binding protein
MRLPIRGLPVVAAVFLLVAPGAAHAQQPVMPVIGFLGTSTAAAWAGYVAGFRQGLSEAGYVDGRNVTIEFRWAEGRSDRLSALAADLVGRRVTVVVTSTGVAAALAAKAATPTIPVVFVMGADPVEFGLVASFNRPGGNLTGVSFLLNVLVPKRLQVLHQLVPTTRAIGVLVHPNNPNAVSDTKNVEAAARALRLRTHVVTARTERDFDAAFAIVIADVLTAEHRERIVALATRNRLPVISEFRNFADSGALTYGSSGPDAGRRAAYFVDKILKGANPAHLPVEQPTKFELVINLRAAKALGLAIPPSLRLRANHVIESVHAAQHHAAADWPLALLAPRALSGTFDARRTNRR